MAPGREQTWGNTTHTSPAVATRGDIQANLPKSYFQHPQMASLMGSWACSGQTGYSTWLKDQREPAEFLTLTCDGGTWRAGLVWSSPKPSQVD